MYSQSTSTAPSHFQPAILSSLQGSTAPQLQGLLLWVHFSEALGQWLLGMFEEFQGNEHLDAKAKAACKSAAYLVYDSSAAINHEALHAINAIHSGKPWPTLPAPLTLSQFYFPSPASGQSLAQILLSQEPALTVFLQDIVNQLPGSSSWEPFLKNLLTTYQKMCTKARQL